MEHELTFQKIKDQVELPQLLAHHGYKLDKGENLGRGKWHVFKGDDTLVVYKGHGGDWMYFNAGDDRDKGSVIDWMKNRVNSGRIPGIEQKADRNVWQSVNDNFRAYLNLPEAQRPKLDLPAITPTVVGEKFQSIYTKDCRPLDNTTYLESRGITKETLQHPQFAGRILNQYHTVQKEGMPPKTFVNTAFPAYHEGRVVGLELKGEGFKGQAPESEFARSLWLSKPPQQPAATMFISESSVDTLSYAQMKPSDSTQYAATAGLLTQNKIFEIKRVMDEMAIPTIRAGFDNDAPGHHYDTRLLAGFATEKNPVNVVREHKTLLSIDVTTENAGQVQRISQAVADYNNKTIAHYHEANGTDPKTTPLDATLRAELIGCEQKQANTYQFHVPINREALNAFNQAALMNLQFEKKIELVKSQTRDWNLDLKQDQMQRVVQRELGPVEQQQAQAGPLKTDEPKQLSAEQQAQAKAHANGERFVVLEVRESRDAISQMPGLREKLEKVGLAIDHTTKLEPIKPREIATELTLRYRIDSPQLPSISQALTSLATNPIMKVVEPLQDATERRQLATAQEQAQAQKRQATPQIQASEFPAHDQARQAFVTAAGPLVQQLREAGKGLDAQRLVEVSKQMERQPQLTGLNRENVEKVLAVVDKIPSLKEAPHTQQLREAVKVLEKDPHKQEQKQQTQKAEEPRKRGLRV